MRHPLIHLWLIALLLIQSCTVLPKVDDKKVSQSLERPSNGDLATAANRIAGELPKGKSAFLLIKDAKSAFDWRLALIDSATSSIDIQLYLWHSGASSSLLFERALLAADRGVRVRILVDDFLLNSNEAGLASLCKYHPNVEIRLFNPGRVRNSSLGKITEMLANFRSLNRRMHNKTFTVDNSLSIVGGRNIGDHYYGMDKNYNFIDLDVLAAGPVVDDVSRGFDLFWNSTLSFPGSRLTTRTSTEKYTAARAKINASLGGKYAHALSHYPLERQSWTSQLAALPRGMHFAEAVFIQDHPEVDLDDRHLVNTLKKLRKKRTSETLIVSPYLIPSGDSFEKIRTAINDGVKLQVLTPCLEANNQPFVDGHYRRYRPKLVDVGTQLHEFRPDPSASVRAMADVAPTHSRRITLHAKTIVADRRWSFVGSLNLDPRALDINTESGLLIDSRSFSKELTEWILVLTDDHNAWAVSRNDKGRIQWQSRGETRLKEPPAHWVSRFFSRVAGMLPIQSQL